MNLKQPQPYEYEEPIFNKKMEDILQLAGYEEYLIYIAFFFVLYWRATVFKKWPRG